jgi:hypothetical protein
MRNADVCSHEDYPLRYDGHLIQDAASCYRSDWPNGPKWRDGALGPDGGCVLRYGSDRRGV